MLKLFLKDITIILYYYQIIATLTCDFVKFLKTVTTYAHV